MNPSSFLDAVRPFQVEGLDVRGRVVRLGPLLGAMQTAHDYPPEVATMLSETAALAVVLASGLKYDGLFTLQIQGSGPIALVVVDVTSEGAMRGYARFDADGVARADEAAGGRVPKYLGTGHMAFTVDQGRDMDRYQGIVALEGADLAACAQAYFQQSEQMETAILLVGRGETAGALMVQRLPGETGAADDREEAWRRAVILMSSTSADELLDPALDAETLLYRLYHEDGVRVFQPKALAHACRCSGEKVATTLKSFPEVEIRDLLEDGPDGPHVTVTCEFCKAAYVFGEDDLGRLFAA